MAARVYSQFSERKVASPGKGPAAGTPGTPGAEAAGKTPPTKTAPWPASGPGRASGSGFNKTTKARVVKTTPHRIGVDA